MKDGRRLLPRGWQGRVLLITVTALAGNLLMRAVPWPHWILSSYEMGAAVERGIPGWNVFMVLFFAPVVEEGVFRLYLFGKLLRDRLGFWGAAVLSSLAFGAYHGNWIQGVYGCLMGLALAWGYESSEYYKYRMVVVMHGAANLAVMVVFH